MRKDIPIHDSAAIEAVSVYLTSIKQNLAHGDATEHTHRPALKTLLEAVGDGIIATNEPKRILCGAPDFNITRNKVPLGHVETKDIDTNLDEIERGKGPHGEQFKRYLTLPNWILTDYLEFRWFVGGEKRLTARIGEIDSKGKLKPLPDGEEKLAQLLNAFFKQEALTIGTAKELAQRMAGMTRIIRDLIVNTFEHEKEQGWLHNWLAAFRETLIPDLAEAQFADMFAQTLAYGLFAARVHTPPNKEFSREMAAYNLPKTNPFLRKLFSEIAGVDMPETIDWAVDDVVELLKHADMFEILKDFGKGKGKEDPVVHFYETFLAAYDPKMREVRGVYYTPEPVVSYIVRSIDHLLKTRFDRPKGLADENTLVLDPATGTATFLYFVVDQIYQNFAKQKGAWDSYVAQHLLNRIFGFELLMAPYAIAHLKLGMQLQETGYQFGSDQRLGIYLTNTLEEAAKKSERLFAQWISDEANAAAEIKRDKPIMVVLGNPPYSGISANRSKGDDGKLTFVGRLIEDYKQVDGKRLEERKHWLQDDYVKFIRFAEWRIEKTGYGIVGLITNHSYLDNPTFPGMRQHLLKSFNEIYVLDLHGNSKKKERAPDGSEDKNVFDIQQGVAIVLCVKNKGDDATARVFHSGLWGQRQSKYKYLFETSFDGTNWKEITARSPAYFFVPKSSTFGVEYEQGMRIPDIMAANVTGIVTSRDEFIIDFSDDPILERVKTFLDPELTDQDVKARLRLSENYAWRVGQARKQLVADKDWRSQFVDLLYRPFDRRRILYNDAVVWRRRDEIMRHMLQAENLGLILGRAGAVIGDDEWNIVAVTRDIIDFNIFRRGGGQLHPLYLLPDSHGLEGLLHEEKVARPNLSPAFLRALSERLKLPPTKPHGLPKGITPEDIFHYAYAVFHSPTYRTRYAEFLRIDFPRLPLTSDRRLFRALAGKGAELVALHLMESPKLNDFITEFPAKGSNAVEKVEYTDKDQRVWINAEQFFGGVPKTVWDFHIGGYQVCHKWLKDRKGRKLSFDDVQHYQGIVVALNETTQLMQEIDALIPAWPIQ